MLDVIIQMAGLILCGVGWRIFKPAGLEHAITRKVLTTLVYYLLLPSLVLSVLWKSNLGDRSFIIITCAVLGVLVGLLLMIISCRMCKSAPADTGAIVLAAAFPNATYLGLPVLEATFGDWSRSVAIQYDLFACTPLLFSVGVLLAARYGGAQAQKQNMLRDIMMIPALWAGVIAVVLNLSHVPMPNIVEGLLSLLERGVVPLMLFSLGLSLQWDASQWKRLPSLVPVVVFSLYVIPATVLFAATQMGLSGDYRAAIVLEAAMPSAVIGIVLCDKFNLNVSLYAAAVTLTTALSIVTLPMWYGWLS